MAHKKATSEEKNTIRAIAKAHGVKGCVQPLHAVMVGKQGTFLDLSVVSALIADLTNAGFLVEDTFGNLVDVLMVWKAA